MNYDRVAEGYDWLATLYSGGGISRAKHAHVPRLRAGARVLYLGCGQGRECVAAAKHGADVTVVDTSRRMLQSCARRFLAAGKSAHFLEQDARHLSMLAPFDVVIAPFFLNVFSEHELPHALRAVLRYLRPDGQFISVDFRAPGKGWFSWLQRAYYLPPLLLFRLVSNNPWHPLYDYTQVCDEHHLPVALTQRTIHPAWGCPLLETLVWNKLSVPDEIHAAQIS